MKWLSAAALSAALLLLLDPPALAQRLGPPAGVPAGAAWAADDSGHVWYSLNPNDLARQIVSRNAELAAERGKAQAKPPTGVVFEQFPRVGRERSWGNAQPTEDADRADAGLSAVKPDVFLTVVGPGSDDVVRRLDADPTFRNLRERMGGRLAVHAYPRGYPTNEGLGIEDGGDPDILIQTADGAEFRRWHSDPGADVIAGEVRRADPNYRPGRDDAEELSASRAATAAGVAAGMFALVLLGLLTLCGVCSLLRRLA